MSEANTSFFSVAMSPVPKHWYILSTTAIGPAATSCVAIPCSFLLLACGARFVRRSVGDTVRDRLQLRRRPEEVVRAVLVAHEHLHDGDLPVDHLVVRAVDGVELDGVVADLHGPVAAMHLDDRVLGPLGDVDQ